MQKIASDLRRRPHIDGVFYAVLHEWNKAFEVWQRDDPQTPPGDVFHRMIENMQIDIDRFVETSVKEEDNTAFNIFVLGLLLGQKFLRDGIMINLKPNPDDLQ